MLDLPTFDLALLAHDRRHRIALDGLRRGVARLRLRIGGRNGTDDQCQVRIEIAARFMRLFILLATAEYAEDGEADDENRILNHGWSKSFLPLCVLCVLRGKILDPLRFRVFQRDYQ